MFCISTSSVLLCFAVSIAYSVCVFLVGVKPPDVVTCDQSAFTGQANGTSSPCANFLNHRAPIPLTMFKKRSRPAPRTRQVSLGLEEETPIAEEAQEQEEEKLE